MENCEKFTDFIDKMSSLIDNARKQGHIIVRIEDLESIIPELKESEDERIRKVLYGWVDTMPSSNFEGGFSRGEILAWLEKQGEQVDMKKALRTEYEKGRADAIRDLRALRGNKEKPAEWSEEDEKMLKGVEQCVYDNTAKIGINKRQRYVDWLKTLRPQKHADKDGIYIVYKDGTYSKFTGNESKDEVSGIGVIYDGHSFQIALEDLGEWPLVRDIEECPEESPFYKTECKGLHDWDFVSATNHIKEVGTDIPLPEGWYIPTLAVLEVMCFLWEGINEVIEFVGGTPMSDSFHWCSTESCRNNARYVYFSNGNANYYGKYSSLVVRPVAAFNLEA